MEGLVYLTLEQAERTHEKTIQYSGGGTYEHFDLGAFYIIYKTMITIQRLRKN